MVAAAVVLSGSTTCPRCADPQRMALLLLRGNVLDLIQSQAHFVCLAYTFMVCATAISGLGTSGSDKIFRSYSSKDGIRTLAFFA